MNSHSRHRVLIIDDNPSIQNDFRKILCPEPTAGLELRRKEALLFGESRPQAPQRDTFEVVSAFGGEEGLEAVLQARRVGRPFALAFVDVRMPPGIDGVETIERIWPIDPEIQTVICSAYSDFTANDILERLGVSDRLLLLRKPCETAEILLLAAALCRKWSLARTAGGVRARLSDALV